MSKLKLSVIIPMYNVGAFVERCLRSLEDQDLPKDEYELICINDGSPDNCREVVEGLQQEFNNIVLINQVNQGVSLARNNGIDQAKGEYLLFIDPDDYVKRNVLNRCLDLLLKNDVELGITGYIILSEDLKEEYIYEIDNSTNEIMTGISFFNNFLRGRSEIRDPDRSWGIFFKHSLIQANNLKYIPDVPYLEDGEMMSRVFCLAQKTVFIKEPFYLRTTRQGSATHSKLFYSEKAINGFYKAAVNLHSFRDSRCRSNEESTFMNQPIIKFTMLYLTAMGFKAYFSNYKRLTCQLKNASLDHLETTGTNKLYTRMAYYYNIGVFYFYIYWFFHTIKVYLAQKIMNTK